MQYLTAEDWIRFDEEFPGAAAWLRKRSLRREYDVLYAELNAMYAAPWCDERRKAWVIDRVHELAELFAGQEV